MQTMAHTRYHLAEMLAEMADPGTGRASESVTSSQRAKRLSKSRGESPEEDGGGPHLSERRPLPH